MSKIDIRYPDDTRKSFEEGLAAGEILASWKKDAVKDAVAARLNDRLIDLSQAAARALGFERQGLAQVHVTYLGLAQLDDAPIRPGETRQYAMAQCVLPRPRALVC